MEAHLKFRLQFLRIPESSRITKTISRSTIYFTNIYLKYKNGFTLSAYYIIFICLVSLTVEVYYLHMFSILDCRGLLPSYV